MVPRAAPAAGRLAVSACRRGSRGASLTFAVVTILLSWSFIQFIFAFHYAHEFYADHRGQARGLAFPNDEAPDYWDFLYFSFVIGMTSQVSDVCVTSKSLRRIVTAHSLLSFLFNVTLLALAINLPQAPSAISQAFSSGLCSSRGAPKPSALRGSLSTCSVSADIP